VSTGSLLRTSDPNFHEVTLLHFKQFHSRIYPILRRLIDDGNLNTEFANKWKQVQQSLQRIHEQSTFCAVSKAFALKDLKDYMRCINTVPGIDKFVTLSTSTMIENGFKAVFHPEIEEVSLLTPNLTNSSKNFQDSENERQLYGIPKDNDSITTVPQNGKVCYGSDADIHEMLLDLWPHITAFLDKQPNHDRSMQWTNWINNSLTPSSGLRDVKRIMGIDALLQLYLILRDSPAINTMYDIEWDHKIHYHLKSQLLTDPVVTPSHTIEIDQSNDNRKSIHNIYFMDYRDDEFQVFHKLVFETINEWSHTEAKMDTTWLQWRKWTLAGLKAVQSVQCLKKILQINDIHGYVTKMGDYHVFNENFMVYMDDPSCLLQYSYAKEMSDISQPAGGYVTNFFHFTQLFEVRMHRMVQQMADMQQRVEAFETTQKNYYTTIKSTTQQLATSIVNETLTSFSQQIEHIIQQRYTTVDKDLSQMVDDMLQDVSAAADEAHTQLQQSVEETMEDFKANIASEVTRMKHNINFSSSNQPPLKSNRFPHVTLDSNFRRSPNPYDTTASLPDTTYHRSPPTFHDQSYTTNPFHTSHVTQPPTAPSTVHVNHDMCNAPQLQSYAKHSLPQVNHEQALKRAKIQFTGLGDMFVFYNQILNGMEQLGIYLVPLNKVTYQIDLCPTHVNGIPITSHHRQTMASTLYQKLHNTDIISMDYTSIHNIINCFAERNDGYDVLYAMLELVHPALQKDAVIIPPKSHECDDDIHTCYQKFDAWLRYEAYADRPYSPREQVNHFIRELSPHFAPAVDRIRRLLDAWNPFDNTVPEALKITSLPNMIERYMMEETGTQTSIIRRVHDRKHSRGVKPMKSDSGMVDKFCHFCGMYGHIMAHCEFMAKLILATESLSKVDGKTKKKLQEAFRAEQKKRRDKRMQRKANVIRKLLDTGGTRADIEAALSTMTESIRDDDASVQDDMDNASSTSTSE